MINLMETKDIDKLIATNLRRIRKQRRMTQDQIAAIIKNQKTKVSALERGRETMGKEIMARLCTELKIQPYEFFINHNTPIPHTALELKTFNVIRAAEQFKVQHIAEEAAEYVVHRLEKITGQPLPEEIRQPALALAPPRDEEELLALYREAKQLGLSDLFLSRGRDLLETYKKIKEQKNSEEAARDASSGGSKT